MTVTNDPTGRRSTCTACGEEVEEALLLKGFRNKVRDPNTGRTTTRRSPGTPTWRTVDRGPGSAVCRTGTDGSHVPGKITMHSAR